MRTCIPGKSVGPLPIYRQDLDSQIAEYFLVDVKTVETTSKIFNHQTAMHVWCLFLPFIDRGDEVGVRSCRSLCREDTVFVLLGSKVGDRMEFTEILAEDTDPLAIDSRACSCGIDIYELPI